MFTNSSNSEELDGIILGMDHNSFDLAAYTMRTIKIAKLSLKADRNREFDDRKWDTHNALFYAKIKRVPEEEIHEVSCSHDEVQRGQSKEREKTSKRFRRDSWVPESCAKRARLQPEQFLDNEDSTKKQCLEDEDSNTSMSGTDIDKGARHFAPSAEDDNDSDDERDRPRHSDNEDGDDKGERYAPNDWVNQVKAEMRRQTLELERLEASIDMITKSIVRNPLP